jgi:PAS domain S-box-containing protein
LLKASLWNHFNVDQQGNILFWNNAASRIFGYSVDEIYDKPLTVLMPSKYRKDHLNGVRKVVTTGKSDLIGKSLEMTGLRKNGEEFPIDLSLSKWEIGEEKYFTGIVRDITRRKELQQEIQSAKDVLESRVEERTVELLEMNEKLRSEILERKKIEKEIRHERKRLFSVLDELPASVHLLRPDHTIVFANRYFKQQFGDELQKPCYKVLHGEDKACDVCNAFTVFESGIPGEYEEEHANGRIYRVYNYPFTDTDKSNLILQLGIDITDHKKAEEALRKSEERFRILVNSIDDTVFTLDRRQHFLEIYGNLFDRLGISAKKSLNKSLANVLDPRTYKYHDAEIEKALKGENVMYEWSVSNKDDLRYVQNSISPIFDKQGKADGVVGVARDITLQKKLEKQLIETEKLMTVAEMSAMISHEFRNSLTSVRMILELQLESENLETAEKNSLSVALNSVNHMEDIVSQLLNFSRPKPMVFKPENLNDIVLESVNFTHLHLEKKQITLESDLFAEIPSLEIDKHHLKEALINLILNAIQAISLNKNSGQSRNLKIRTEAYILKNTLRALSFSDIMDSNVSKKIKVRTPELILEQGKKCVRITIRDTGIGIKSENLNRIFNPFYTTVTQGGTGLGLSMVKRTVNAHGGIIRVDSKYGEGTVFYIYLPINK